MGYLALSGILGFVVGDLLLFKSFTMIGARISMLIYASSPIFSALFAWIILGEALKIMEIAGIVIAFWGILLVMFTGNNEDGSIKLTHPLLGVLLASFAAIVKSLAYIISKSGMGSYNPVAATQIRTIAAIVSFVIIFIFMKQYGSFFKSLKETKAIKSALIGSFFGPFLAVSLTLYSLQRINPGIAATLMSITPVVLIAYDVIIKKETIQKREIVGSIVAIAGISIMFL